MKTRETRDVIERLVDDAEPIDEKELEHLSNLTREEQGWLQSSWDDVAPDKRRRLIALTSEAADEDFRLNFSAVNRIALRDEEPEIRRMAVDALWEDESVTLVRPFLTLLRTDQDEGVRASAASALGRFVLQGELEQIASERLEEIVESLIGVVRNPVEPLDVRRRAIEALGYSGDERVPTLIARAYEDPEEEMRSSALFAMGRSADSYWSGIVRGELLNESARMRYEAARAAGELADPLAVERLKLLLRDAAADVRDVAIWALGQIGGKEARRALQEVATSGTPTMRSGARDSLAEMDLFDDDRAVLALGDLLGGEDDVGVEDLEDGLEFELLDDEDLRSPDESDDDDASLPEPWVPGQDGQGDGV